MAALFDKRKATGKGRHGFYSLGTLEWDKPSWILILIHLSFDFNSWCIDIDNMHRNICYCIRILFVLPHFHLSNNYDTLSRKHVQSFTKYKHVQMHITSYGQVGLNAVVYLTLIAIHVIVINTLSLSRPWGFQYRITFGILLTHPQCTMSIQATMWSIMNCLSERKLLLDENMKKYVGNLVLHLCC